MRKSPNWPTASGFTLTLTALVAFAAGTQSANLGATISNKADSVRAWTGSGKTAGKHPATREGAGVTINSLSHNDDLVLLAGTFSDGDALRLVRRDGSVVARWSARESAHFGARVARVESAMMRPDGSVVAVHAGGGAVKLDRCGQAAWVLDEMAHGSIQPAMDGGYWTVARSGEMEIGDTIIRVSENGDVIDRIPARKLLFQAGLDSVFTAGASSTAELDLRVDKVEELDIATAAAFPDFDAGDLLLSLRHYNLLLVVDAEARIIKWHQTGPWVRQTDPEFRPDGTITMFNTNHYDGLPDDVTTRRSSIMRVEPWTGEVSVVYGAREGEMLSGAKGGSHQALADGGMLVAETAGGRIFQTDETRTIVWEYINRLDPDHVLEIADARVYPKAFFEVGDWSCGAPDTPAAALTPPDPART